MSPIELVKTISSDPEALRQLSIAIQQQTLQGLQPTSNDDRWVLSKDAWKALGFSCYKDLHDAIVDGLLRVGEEVHDMRKLGAQRPRYQVNLKLARERLKTRHDKRSRI